MQVPAIGGPHVYEMAALVRGYLRAAHRRRPIIGLGLPGKAAAAMRDGANLVPDRAGGRRTWEDFLAERVGSPRDDSSRSTTEPMHTPADPRRDVRPSVDPHRR